MSAYKFRGYNIRGICEHIRLMFVAAGVPFEDERVPHEQRHLYMDRFWEFMTIEFDGKRVHHHIAIPRVLAVELGLEPEDPYLAAKADEIVSIMEDVRYEYRTYLKHHLKEPSARTEAMKKRLVEEVFPVHYAIMNEKIGALAGDFISGTRPTWQDLYIASSLDIYADNAVGVQFLDKYPALKGVLDSVFGIPQIGKYVKERPFSQI